MNTVAKIEISPMVKDHLDQVLQIERESFAEPWGRSAFLDHLAHPEFANYLVALKEQKVVGYVGLFFAADYGQLTNLAVDPDFRRHKIATQLLLSIIRRSQAAGLVTLSLEVRVSNQAAQNLYKKFGFEVVDIRKNYYQETNEDAYVMCLFGLENPENQKRFNQMEDLLKKI
jgi:ribosomal-protein-alanine N-acetyltransferase